MNMAEVRELSKLIRSKTKSGIAMKQVFRQEVVGLERTKQWSIIMSVAQDLASNMGFPGAIALVYHAFELTQENVASELPKFLANCDLRDRLTALSLNIAEDLLGLPRDILYVLSGRKD